MARQLIQDEHAILSHGVRAAVQVFALLKAIPFSLEEHVQGSCHQCVRLITEIMHAFQPTVSGKWGKIGTNLQAQQPQSESLVM